MPCGHRPTHFHPLLTHRYLKQVIPAPSSGPHGRFTSVRWHPEDALCLTLSTQRKPLHFFLYTSPRISSRVVDVIQRTYAWETCVSHVQAPNDTGASAVVDGGNLIPFSMFYTSSRVHLSTDKLLLTPFRAQNVPPPMSSAVLSISLPSPSQTRTTIPIHTAFSPTHDRLAVLWESGVVQLFEMHTRVGPATPSGGKVVEPEKVFEGVVFPASWENDGSRAAYSRQVVLSTPSGDSAQPSDTRIAILASSEGEGGCDVVCARVIRDSRVVETYDVRVPRRDGRLVQAEDAVVWQGPEGEVFVGEFAAWFEFREQC